MAAAPQQIARPEPNLYEPAALEAASQGSDRVNPTVRKFLLFAIAGGAGFVVDAGIAYSLQAYAGLGFYVARAISFVISVGTTWIINRSLAFKAQRADHLPIWREFLHYLGARLLGGSVNIVVAFILYGIFHPSRELSVLCVACGVIAGMFVNFLQADKLVFRLKATPSF